MKVVEEHPVARNPHDALARRAVDVKRVAVVRHLRLLHQVVAAQVLRLAVAVHDDAPEEPACDFLQKHHHHRLSTKSSYVRENFSRMKFKTSYDYTRLSNCPVLV